MGASLGSVLNPTLTLLEHGFEQANAVQAIAIAIAAAIVMKTWPHLFAVALAAALVHIGVDSLAPVIVKGARLADIRWPHLLSVDFWRYALALYAGFVALVAMFFAVKRVVYRRSEGAAAGAKGHGHAKTHPKPHKKGQN